jgi:hypothetical protein
MSLGERLERRADLPRLPNPYAGERPGYSQPDAIDPSGYSLSDRYEPAGNREIPDVSPPGLSRVGGRLSEASYGDDTVHPVPGGALGEAGACWRSGDFEMPRGEWIGEQHAIRPTSIDDAGAGASEPRAD